MTARPLSRPAVQPDAGRFDRVARRRIRDLAANSGRLLVVSDFDGTLAPISLDPMAVRMEPSARTALRRLARIAWRRPDRLRVAILSGRTTIDLASRVRVGRLVYLGNHGLEGGSLRRDGRAGRMSVTSDPSLAPFEPAAVEAGRAVAAALGEPAWLFVEQKGPSVAFHYRAAPDPDAAGVLVDRAVSAHLGAVTPSELERFDLRRIVELRPIGAGGKGAAVARLVAREQPDTALVLGDDRSDAEAFRAVRAAVAAGSLRAALTVAVHAALETPRELAEGADLIVTGPRQAARVLAALATALERVRGA